jgi:hypothetical protein
MELLYSFNSITMTIWTFTRWPVVGSECTKDFLKSLEEYQTRKNGHIGKNVAVFRFSRWSSKTAAAQQRQCEEVQRRMDFNDNCRKAYREEGVHRANHRNRDRERGEIKKAERQNAKARRDIQRESEDEEVAWEKAKKKHFKAMYGDQRQKKRQRSVSPDPSESESGEDGSGTSSYEEEAPSRRTPSPRRPRREPVEPTGSRRPQTQQRIDDAIEYLRRFGIETVTPNGGK